MAMKTKNLLIISHGHPAIRSGGCENASYALYQAFQALPHCRSMFLAGAPSARFDSDHDVIPFGTDGREWLIRQSDDWLHFQSTCHCDFSSSDWDWLHELSPDVISIHHIMEIGLDLLLSLRNLFPKAKFVYTLHEFLLMCPFNGQLKTREGSYCSGPTMAGCMACLPHHSARELRLRQARIQAFMSVVDHFIAPSATVRNSFIDWGVHPSTIALVPNVLSTHFSDQQIDQSESASLGHVFAFFGNCSANKGIDIILEAMLRLVPMHPQARLVIHGPLLATLESAHHSDPYAARVKQMLQELGAAVRVAGPYRQHEISRLMVNIGWVVMGSRWLENAPVVIQEALACRRPLLVPSLGGMAEHVRNGLDGLHFVPESASSLAAVMDLACSEFGIWSQLHASLGQPLSSRSALSAHARLFGWEAVNP